VVAPGRSDQTITVPLGGVLPAGATATVYVGYSAVLRSGTAGSDWMFTRANGIVDMYRWIPWVSLARRFDRPNHGDPFVTPVSPRVTVRLTSDRSLVIATSGQKVADAGLTEHYVATNVRDFVLTAAPDYRTASRRVDGVFIQAFVRPGIAASSRVDIAARMIRAMAARVGPYPYPQLLIAQSAGGYAMEGPGIIWLPGAPSGSQLTYLIAHETAHQWFYGAVGNDQAIAPFTDEAAADFLARNVLASRRASRCATAPLDRTIYDYSASCYYETVYIQGANVLDDLRRRMGDTRFWAVMRTYVSTWRWKLAPPRALLDALDAATPLDFGPVYRARFPRWY
jgi:aminopeptidase N